MVNFIVTNRVYVFIYFMTQIILSIWVMFFFAFVRVLGKVFTLPVTFVAKCRLLLILQEHYFCVVLDHIEL